MRVKSRGYVGNKELVVLVCGTCNKNEVLKIYGTSIENLDMPNLSLMDYVTTFMRQACTFEIRDIID